MSATKLAVVYDFFPHYRGGIIKELNGSSDLAVTFVGDPVGVGGIAVYEFPSEAFISAPCRRLKSTVVQWRVLRDVVWRPWHAIVFLGHPYNLSTWLAAIILRLRGIPVLFWAHGWLARASNQRGIAAKVRDVFFGLADHILVYGNEAAEIGRARGFKNISVVSNSLDYRSQLPIQMRLVSGELVAGLPGFQREGAALIACSNRLIPGARMDLVVEALGILEQRGRMCDLAVIGDGPERARLESRAAALGLNARFVGALYDEEVIAKILYAADVNVLPGKAGLSANHAMTYGSPVLTHNRWELQMPEHETIIDGVTGAYFKYGSAEAVADAIEAWLVSHPDREAVRRACFARIEEAFTPEYQVRVIMDALHAVGVKG